MTKSNTISINNEYIKLGQFLKKIGIISLGSEAKYFLDENTILVNGEIEKRRGRKLFRNYEIDINGLIYKIS